MASSNWAIVETTKNICCAKGEVEIDGSTVTTRKLKKFSGVSMTSTIRQGQLDLKVWIPRPCFKS